MAADFNKPVTTDSYSNVLAEVRDNDVALALGLDPATTTPANVPTNAIRWTSAANKWQKYNGATWVDLAATYDISISGNAATASVAAAAPWSGVTGKPTTLSGYGISDAVPMAGGVSMTGLFSLSGNATSAMQPVPKQQLDAAIAGISVPVTSVFGRTGAVALQISDITPIDGAGSGLDADLLDGQHASAFSGTNKNFDWELVYNQVPGVTQINLLSNWGYGLYCFVIPYWGQRIGSLTISPTAPSDYIVLATNSADARGCEAAKLGIQCGSLDVAWSIYKLRKTA